MSYIEILLAVALILFILCYNINRLLGLPPGPTPWPLIGNTFQLPMSGIDNRLRELRKQYGDVFTLWLPYPTVIINGHEALKRTVIRDGESYAGRPDTYVMILLVEGNYGLIFEENDWYRSQRRFTLHTLKNLGVGRDTIKKAITMLAHRTVDLLRQTNGEPIELRNYLTNAVGNVINQLALGFIRPHEDKEIIEFQTNLNEVFEHFTNPKMLLLDIMPFLRHFDRFIGFGIKTTLHGNDAILEFIQKQYDYHKKTINYDQEPTNYLDAYLHEIKRRKDEGVVDEFTEKQCVIAIYDLYSAGLETIVITLRYCFHFILNYPSIQEKIHNEIDNAIGRERDITMDDQKVLPYTCAFLQEVYRAGYVLHVNFLRMTLKDVDCEGYKLRKGTRVIPQFQSVHMDESIFPRPELIIPERHLKDGQCIKDDRINGFSVGKRACLGENLARMEVFMFFTSLMQKFRFEPEGLYPPKLELLISTFRAPLPFKIRVIDRCSK
nr:Cytochrome P450 domain containing protein [Haemonchus contortus]